MDPVSFDKIQKYAILDKQRISYVSQYDNPVKQKGDTGEFSQYETRKMADQISFSILEKREIDQEQKEPQDITEQEIVFDIEGIEAPLANALRRTAIAEVKTMAIEKVFIYQNTSIFPDETLAHRLGLVPIYAGTQQIANYFTQRKKDQDFSASNCLKFRLHKQCSWKSQVDELPDEEKYANFEVMSGDVEWVPLGDQSAKLPSPPRPVLSDILLAKLRPGQQIECELYCEIGDGKEHAKWSPVSPCFYKLVPEVILKRKVMNQEAELLKKTCPMGVFEIEEIGSTGRSKKSKKTKGVEAVVRNPRNCTACRECLREERLQDAVQLLKRKQHYEFHIESAGQLRPSTIFLQSVGVIKGKAAYWKEAFKNLV